MDSATLSCSITNPNEPNTPPKSFAFDGVYGPDSTTEAIYNDNGFALVEVNKYMYIEHDSLNHAHPPWKEQNNFEFLICNRTWILKYRGAMRSQGCLFCSELLKCAILRDIIENFVKQQKPRNQILKKITSSRFLERNWRNLYNFRECLRVTMERFLPMDRRVAGKVSLCRVSLILPHRGESYPEHSSIFLR